MQVIIDTLFPDSVRTRARTEHRPSSLPEVVSMADGPTLYSGSMLGSRDLCQSINADQQVISYASGFSVSHAKGREQMHSFQTT